MDTLHEDQYALMNLPRSFLPRMRNVSDKHCRENKNTRSVFSSFLFLYKIMPFMRQCVKYSTAGQATDDSITYAHCVPGT
jgi:hypothetical protein